MVWVMESCVCLLLDLFLYLVFENPSHGFDLDLDLDLDRGSRLCRGVDVCDDVGVEMMNDRGLGRSGRLVHDVVLEILILILVLVFDVAHPYPFSLSSPYF